MAVALNILNWVIFVLLAIPVVYFLVFALASGKSANVGKAEGGRKRKFVVLIPAYKSDSCIVETAAAALAQDYPSDNYRVLVISDTMKGETVEALRAKGAEVLEVAFEQSTKAKSLQQAMRFLGEDAADIAVILDADNLVESNFLRLLDDRFENGAQAIQTHRMAKNRDTDIAVIDSVSEEINNSVFRKGHCALGLSSALIGSGMAFGYKWFFDHIDSFTTSGEDKEMELALLREGIFVTYAEDIKVLDEKTRTSGNYYNQRRRWAASQFHLLSGAAAGLKSAKDKRGYFDKIFQWLLPPRMIMITAVPLMTVICILAGAPNIIAWLVLTVALCVAMNAASPVSFLDKSFIKALVKVPYLALLSVANLFRMRGTKDKFIHTEHK